MVEFFDSEDELESIIKFWQPYVLVKGSDYSCSIDKIVGHKIAKKVEFIPLLDGYSTSEIIERIRLKYGK